MAEVRRRFLSEHRGRELDRSGRFAADNRRWVEDGLAGGWYRAWVAEADNEVVGGVSLLVHRCAPLPEDGRPLYEREGFTTSDRFLHLGVPD